MIGLKKVFRYFKIYGLQRTINKVAGRKRELSFLGPLFINKKPFIGLIGCGQFQFSTIAYFLSSGLSNRFLFCFDVDLNKTKTLGLFYKIPLVIDNIEDIYKQRNLRLVYIASNHSTHTEYSISFLQKGVDVYCEKPISVNFDQFDSLIAAIKKSSANFFAGYNRPYSPAICKISDVVKSKARIGGKFSLNCFVTAHFLSDDHWYRNPEEGTRVCGNIGHWLDLMIHVFNWRGYIPEFYKVQIAYSNLNEPDDNIVISITTNEGDVTSITITSRSEPFEGINETINLQYDTVIAKIDDFRNLTIWDQDKIYSKNYRPKDVGHKRSVKQPFSGNNRDLKEVIASTELMLHITDMVRVGNCKKNVQLIRKL